MDMLEGLNEDQRLAVAHGTGPMLVVAGAGTGKTQVITRRIAYLIKGGKARPGQILALTFTEKAAREMEDRLYGLIGWESFQVPVMTFHAFGAELLGRFASHIGRSVRGGLLNDIQKSLLIKQHISRINLSYYGLQSDEFEFVEGIVDFINELQNSGITAEAYLEYASKLKSDPGDRHPQDINEQIDLAALYGLYEELKRETGTYDYHDQLSLPLDILKQRPNLAERLSGEYSYVLVDEYQDTNSVQDELLRTFIGPGGNIFAVGDDDQAIYGFRGADVGNILAFTDHYRLDHPVVLSRNYRSGQAILDHAYRLIQHNNPERLEHKLSLNKRLQSFSQEAEVKYVAYKTTDDERQAVLASIKERIANGQAASGIAVLASTHAPLRALAKLLRGQDVPFALSTAANIFEQPELMGLWHLLRWICFEANEEAIGHVMMGPFVNWTSDEYRQLLEVSRQEMTSFEEALHKSEQGKAKELALKLAQWRTWAVDLPVSQLAFKLVFETGVADKWRKQAEGSARMMRVFEDLQRLFSQMQDFETVATDGRVLDYAKTFPKPPSLEVSEAIGDEDGVQLLTVHASKGLEFEVVYLIGCHQRNWTQRRTSARAVPPELDTRAGLPPDHEMRRLMYVAVTRAKRELVVSSAVQTSQGARQALSPLVHELFEAGQIESEPISILGTGVEDVMTTLQRFYPLAAAGDIRRLPFEAADGWLDLSVTSLSKYDRCPFDFYIEEVLQIRHPFGPQLAFGNVLHRLFELYYKASLGTGPVESGELHQALDEIWSDRGYSRRELAQADRALAHQTLDRFMEREGRSERRILASEMAVRFEIPECKLRLRGKIDALFETADGVEVRDFKTGRTKTDADKLAKEAKDNFQLRSYALAYELLNGTAPARVTLDYVVTGVEGTAVLSETILRNHRAKLAAMAGQIRARNFAPDVSPMHVCAAIRYYGTGEQEALADELLTRRLGDVGAR